MSPSGDLQPGISPSHSPNHLQMRLSSYILERLKLTSSRYKQEELANSETKGYVYRPKFPTSLDKGHRIFILRATLHVASADI